MKKWKHKICLLLCAAILLCACNAKEKTYETAYDYLTENITKVTVLPDGTFGTFSKVAETDANAVTKIPLPEGIGEASFVQKVGEHWYLIDKGMIVDYICWQEQGIYCLQDNKWVKLFDKSMHSLYTETVEGLPWEITINLKYEYGGKLYFEVIAVTQNLAPKPYALYGADNKTGQFFTVYEEKNCARSTPFVFVQGSAYVQNCDLEDYRILTDVVRIDLEDLKVTKFAAGEAITDKEGNTVKPFDTEESAAPVYKGSVQYGQEELTAKQVNALNEICSKVDTEVIFPPENENSLNKIAANVLARKGENGVVPLLVPLFNNDNNAEMRGAFYGEKIVIESYGWNSEEKAFSAVLIYDGEKDIMYTVDSQSGDTYFRIQSWYNDTTFAFICNQNLVLVDLTKV